MASSTLPEPTPQPAPTWVDDEIDLRAYLLVLIAWWREIVLITLLAAVATAAAGLLWRNTQPTQYEASADVVIARLTSQFNIDERIATTTETQGVANVSWRASLLELAHSGRLAQEVIADLGDVLPEELRTADALIGAVELTVPTSADGRTLTDIIRISVSAEAPELAAQIANTWAARFIAHINRVYGEIPVETIAALTEEQAAAKAKFDQAQRSLEGFLADSSATTIQRELDALVAVVTAEQATNATLLAATSGASPTMAMGLITADNDRRIRQLNQLYDRRNATLAQLEQAQNLASQLETGGQAAATTSVQALQRLKNQVFAPGAGSNDFPIVIALPQEASGATADAEALLEDVRALVTVLADYVAKLDAAIETYNTEQVNGAVVPPVALTSRYTVTAGTALGPSAIPGYDTYVESQAALLAIDAQIQTLRGKLEAEQSRQRELTQQRDLAWTTYDALSNKLVELNLARTSANSEVRLGSAAVEPSVPVGAPSLRLPVAAATAAAFFAMVLLAFVVNMLGGKPFLSRQQP